MFYLRLSFCSQGGAGLSPGRSAFRGVGQTPLPPESEKRVVRILLECFLVKNMCCQHPSVSYFVHKMFMFCSQNITATNLVNIEYTDFKEI